MAKITIKDLPRDVKVSPEEMRRVLGGTTFRVNAETDPSTIIRMGWPVSDKGGGSTSFVQTDEYDGGYFIVF
jgi:hypothetical protein